MNFPKASRNISIKKRIYFGFFFVLISMTIAAASGIYSLGVAQRNFVRYRLLNERMVSVVELNRSIADLQRNISIFTTTGHASVETRVVKMVKGVRSSLVEVEELLLTEKEKKLAERMKGHLDRYAQTFSDAVKESRIRNQLIQERMPLLLKRLRKGKLRTRIVELESSIFHYFQFPNQNLSREIRGRIERLSKASGIPGWLREDLRSLQGLFLRATQANRSYLYLVSVVMAGEAFEFKYVSNKMKSIILEEARRIRGEVEQQTQLAQQFAVFFLVFILFVGTILSWMISKGIAEPLSAITDTFRRLSRGETAIKIPEQDRQDEIGVLSQAAEIFREKSVQLERSNDELSQFAYRTSHDLKAPLLSIIGLTEIIQDDLNEREYDEVRANVEKVDTSARKLEGLISDILNLSRADSVVDETEGCHVSEMIDSIREKLELMLKENHVLLTYDFKGGDLVQAQRIRLQQVLENLISNAIKYSDPEKSPRYVKIFMEQSRDQVQFVVDDNGLGIPQKGQKELFGMFKRFHSGTSFGSGLGLYLVKKHLERMKGQISVLSEEKVGSRFTVTLPISLD